MEAETGGAHVGLLVCELCRPSDSWLACARAYTRPEDAPHLWGKIAARQPVATPYVGSYYVHSSPVAEIKIVHACTCRLAPPPVCGSANMPQHLIKFGVPSDKPAVAESYRKPYSIPREVGNSCYLFCKFLFGC